MTERACEVLAAATLFLAQKGLSLSTRPAQKNHGTVRFMVIGDWGGIVNFPFTTLTQHAVARQMARTAEKHSPHFILALGDNFYNRGVNGVNDTRFQSTFEEVYNSSHLFIPWYFVAGNHDYSGNVQAQIEYSKYSRRWKFPDYYYKRTKHIPGGKTLDIVLIDTIKLCGKTNAFYQPGPRDFEISEKQWAWIEQQLKQSTADYLLVCGHNPVHSVGSNGPTLLLVERLEPLLYKYDVTAYIAGHDHNMQHIQVENNGTFINYFVSGTGAYVKEGTHHVNTVPKNNLKFFNANVSNQGGFAYFQVSDRAMKMRFIDGTGKEQYHYEIEPRAEPVK